MIKMPLAAYRQEIHLTLLKYQGSELTALALSAGLSRASVYHLRAHAQANARVDTLEKLRACPWATNLPARGEHSAGSSRSAS